MTRIAGEGGGGDPPAGIIGWLLWAIRRWRALRKHR